MRSIHPQPVSLDQDFSPPQCHLLLEGLPEVVVVEAASFTALGGWLAQRPVKVESLIGCEK